MKALLEKVFAPKIEPIDDMAESLGYIARLARNDDRNMLPTFPVPPAPPIISIGRTL